MVIHGDSCERENGRRLSFLSHNRVMRHIEKRFGVAKYAIGLVKYAI